MATRKKEIKKGYFISFYNFRERRNTSKIHRQNRTEILVIFVSLKLSYAFVRAHMVGLTKYRADFPLARGLCPKIGNLNVKQKKNEMDEKFKGSILYL